MSEEIIRLRVPAEPPEGYLASGAKRKEDDERPMFPEYVEQGYHSTELPLGKTIEVKDRLFADWLVREYGLEDLTPPAVSDEEETEAEGSPASDYPEDFPGREVLIENNISIDTAKSSTKEQLVALKGIGEKTADAILEYFARDNGGNE